MAEVTECTPEDVDEFWQNTPQDVTGAVPRVLVSAYSNSTWHPGRRVQGAGWRCLADDHIEANRRRGTGSTPVAYWVGGWTIAQAADAARAHLSEVHGYNAPQESTGRPVSRWDGENVREYAERVRAAESAAQQAELNAYLAADKDEQEDK